MVILSNQDTRARFQNTFEEWTNYSTNEYLHESDPGGFDVVREIELWLLGERPRMLEFTMHMAMENSALYVKSESPVLGKLSLHQTFCFTYLDDFFWRGVELDLGQNEWIISVAIEANQRQHVHQDRRLALKRIAREIEAYEVGMQHSRNILDGLLSETSRLRHGQDIYPENEDPSPVDAVNAFPDAFRLS